MSRVFFFFDGDVIVLTNGFVKKSQRTPTNEFKLAKQYQTNYFAAKKERKNQNER